jgi:hypothetical protein
MRQFAIVLSTISLCLALIAPANLAWADDTTTPAGGSTPATPASTAPGQGATTSINVGKYLVATEQGQSQPVSIGAYIVRLINLLSMAIGSFALLSIIIGGMLLLTSAGGDAQLTKGKDIIKFSIIGLAIAMVAYFITAFVQSIFYEYNGS